MQAADCNVLAFVLPSCRLRAEACLAQHNRETQHTSAPPPYFPLTATPIQSTCGSFTIWGGCLPCLSCCPPPKMNDMRPPPRSPFSFSWCRDPPLPSPEPASPLLSPYLPGCWAPTPLASFEAPPLPSGSPPHGCCPIPRGPGPNPAPPRVGLTALPGGFREGGERIPVGV